MIEKPNTQEITDTFVALRDKVYSELHSKMRRYRDLHNQIIDCAQPKDWPTHIPATGLRLVRWATNQLVTDAIEVEIIPGTQHVKDKDNAERQSLFADKCLTEWDLAADNPIWKETAQNMMLYGLGVVKGPLFDPSAWGSIKDNAPKEEIQSRNLRKKLNFPLLVKPIDPLTFFPDPAGRFAIEAYTRFAGEVKEDIARWNEGKRTPIAYDWGSGIKDYEEILWLEYYSNSWRCFIVLEGPGSNAISMPILDVQRNVYGFLPYAWKFTGWGKTSPDGKPEEKAVGILTGLESDIEQQARGLTALDNQVRAHVYQRLLAPEDAADSIRANISNSPADISYIPRDAMPGQSGGISLWPQPTVNPDLFSMLALSQNDIEQITGHPAMAGGGAQGESGYRAMLRIRQGGLNFRPPRRGLENMIITILTNSFRLLVNLIDETMPLRGDKTIKPDQINEPLDLKVKLEPQDAEEDGERIRLGLLMLKANAITIEQFNQDYARRDDAHMTIPNLLAQQIMLTDPQIAATLGAKGLEALGLEQAAAMMQATATGQAAAVGRPGAGRPDINPEGTMQRLREAPAEGPVEVEAVPLEGFPGMEGL